MSEIKELQREIQYLKWNIYALAYELDKLSKRLGKQEKNISIINATAGYPIYYRPNDREAKQAA